MASSLSSRCSSDIWHHFTKIGFGPRARGKCRYCHAIMANTGGVSNFRRHLALKHPNVVSATKRKSGQSVQLPQCQSRSAISSISADQEKNTANEFALYEVTETSIDVDTDGGSPVMAFEAVYSYKHAETAPNSFHPIKLEVNSEQGENEHTLNGTIERRNKPQTASGSSTTDQNAVVPENLCASALKAQVQKENVVCSSYGVYVGNKLGEYSKMTQAIVQQHINRILFKADMGEFERH